VKRRNKANGAVSGASPSVLLKLPATSANLGPAFDAAALALKLHLRVHATLAPRFRISADGRDRGICKNMDGNLLLQTYRDVLRANGKREVPLALKIDNEIPIGKGLGSSAAARLAGITLASHFGRIRWTDEEIIEEAARREGHADNVAACWLGGFVVVGGKNSDYGRNVSAFRPKIRARWPLLIAVADHNLSTEQARAALPAKYMRRDAVLNVQNAMRLALAFSTGDSSLLASALTDKLHEPYRSALCPLLAPLRALAGHHGIIGAVLSGAGPSVLLFLDSRESATQTRQNVAADLKRNRLSAELLITRIEMRGANARH
jgi:homoserine kinase